LSVFFYQRGDQAQGLPAADADGPRGARLAVRDKPPAGRADPLQAGAPKTAAGQQPAPSAHPGQVIGAARRE